MSSFNLSTTKCKYFLYILNITLQLNNILFLVFFLTYVGVLGVSFLLVAIVAMTLKNKI